MRRADDLDVETVRVVPPVVEWGGGEHGDAAPGCKKGSERGAKTEDIDAGGLHAGIVAEGGPENEIATDDRCEDAAGVDGHVRRRPEGVATD